MDRMIEVSKIEKSIIILNYNTWQLTIDFVESLNKLKGIEQYETIVVDNASPNKSYEYLKEEKEKRNLEFTLIKASSNKGYAAGNNLGLRISYDKGYKYAYVMNTDLIFKDYELLKNMLNIFNKAENIAVVSPRVLTVKEREVNRNLYRPSVWSVTLGRVAALKRSFKICDSVCIDQDSCYNYQPQGCCMLVDLKKINEVNYMDEETFLYGEERILAERFMEKGYRSALCLNTSIIHNHSQTINASSDDKRILEWINASAKCYWIKYRKKSIITWKLIETFEYINFYFKKIALSIKLRIDEKY